LRLLSRNKHNLRKNSILALEHAHAFGISNFMLADFLVTSFFLPRNPPDRNRRAENSGDFLGVVILENSRVHPHDQAMAYFWFPSFISISSSHMLILHLPPQEEPSLFSGISNIEENLSEKLRCAPI